jgi:hypothetical protein
MQVLVQVICTKGLSLRDAIIKDKKLGDHFLAVSEIKRQGRSHGWTKVHSVELSRRGAINIVWDPHSKLLLCRVVTRGAARPNLIVGDFVDYLLKRFPKRIQAINVLPR